MGWYNKRLAKSLWVFHISGSPCNGCDIEILNLIDKVKILRDNYQPKQTDLGEILKSFIEFTDQSGIFIPTWMIDNYIKSKLKKYNYRGLYRLYNKEEIIYVGKSKYIPARIKKHKEGLIEFDSYDFCLFTNESDLNLYEIYYISKLKPIHNNDCNHPHLLSIELKDLDFQNYNKEV